jgi:hypothetical protein
MHAQERVHLSDNEIGVAQRVGRQGFAFVSRPYQTRRVPVQLMKFRASAARNHVALRHVKRLAEGPLWQAWILGDKTPPVARRRPFFQPLLVPGPLTALERGRGLQVASARRTRCSDPAPPDPGRRAGGPDTPSGGVGLLQDDLAQGGWPPWAGHSDSSREHISDGAAGPILWASATVASTYAARRSQSRAIAAAHPRALKHA